MGSPEEDLVRFETRHRAELFQRKVLQGRA
jgi:hypothetical protein